MAKCDFSGWATRNDILCADGRTIRKNAFLDCDGAQVPLVWNHQYNEPENVLGHAVLENRDEGVYMYGYCNDTESGKTAKKLLQHGDIRSLSIYANKLKQVGSNVIHGIIREVSLVHAGANSGAFVDFVLKHGEDGDDGFIGCYDESIVLYHSAEETEEKMEDKEKKDIKSEDEETVADVFDTLSEKQRNVVNYIIGEALKEKDEDDEDDEDEDEGEDEDMKHNVFDQDYTQENDVLCHSDQKMILELAKNGSVGTLQNAIEIYADDNELSHGDVAPVGGFYQSGEGGVSTLFPEYKDVRPGAPELITNDQGWISVVMQKAHKSPISRIRTGQVDIRNIEALRAKGYQKGSKKALTGNMKLVRRTTDPQTIFVKNALHRDDIIDITDFDYVQYLYNIDRMMLNEELATAIMFGDGREDGSEDKIAQDKIRPIWLDDDLYTLHVDIDFEAAKEELQGTDTGAHFGENYVKAEAMINACLYSRENYKGSGTPDMFITPHDLNVMLLARDMNGRRIYSSKSELAASFNVGNIYTVEQMEGKTREASGGKTKKLHALIVNLADYSLGATKGGEITHFTQFDIDFNQQKSLIETRCSGALTRVYSAIAIEEDVTGKN